MPNKISTPKRFQTQKNSNASKTIKTRHLGERRERSLCSRKTKISTNYPASSFRTKIPFRTQNSKRRTQDAQDSATLFKKKKKKKKKKTFKIVFQATQALSSKKQFSDHKSHPGAKSDLKIFQNPKSAPPSPKLSQDLKHFKHSNV